MNLFSKIFSIIKQRNLKEIACDPTNKNQRIIDSLHDDLDYDGMGNYGRFPPIKENKIKNHELQNSK
jgi:hypothetical protein